MLLEWSNSHGCEVCFSGSVLYTSCLAVKKQGLWLLSVVTDEKHKKWAISTRDTKWGPGGADASVLPTEIE